MDFTYTLIAPGLTIIVFSVSLAVTWQKLKSKIQTLEKDQDRIRNVQNLGDCPNHYKCENMEKIIASHEIKIEKSEDNVNKIFETLARIEQQMIFITTYIKNGKKIGK